jgi:CarD family transcriptional regulator
MVKDSKIIAAKSRHPAKKSASTAASKPRATGKPNALAPDKPEPETVKQVTSATKAKPATKPAAKAPAKPAAKVAEVKAAPPPAAEVPKIEETVVEPVQAEVPKPAPAPISHAGVPAGPMRPMTPPRAMAKAEIFVDGDFVVYPTHGVGKVERIATEEIAGHTLELIHITFDENRMTLRVPTNKARTAGLRKLASRKQFDDVLATLKGRARIKRTMWSRRAQEYEAKINSGDPSSIAEVVRDLHRNAGQPDQSFSERQIYESALDRLAAEYGALEQVDKATATERLIAHLKSE